MAVLNSLKSYCGGFFDGYSMRFVNLGVEPGCSAERISLAIVFVKHFPPPLMEI